MPEELFQSVPVIPEAYTFMRYSLKLPRGLWKPAIQKNSCCLVLMRVVMKAKTAILTRVWLLMESSVLHCPDPVPTEIHDGFFLEDCSRPAPVPGCWPEPVLRCRYGGCSNEACCSFCCAFFFFPVSVGQGFNLMTFSCWQPSGSAGRWEQVWWPLCRGNGRWIDKKPYWI